MKIAVLSDIHSNVFALDAVIKDIKKHSVDLKANLDDLGAKPLAWMKSLPFMPMHLAQDDFTGT